jgi:hypothetical protein
MKTILVNPKLTRLCCNIKTLSFLMLLKKLSYASRHQLVGISVQIGHLLGVLYSKEHHGYRIYNKNALS